MKEFSLKLCAVIAAVYAATLVLTTYCLTKFDEAVAKFKKRKEKDEV